MNHGRAIYFLFYAAAACLTPYLTLHYEALGLPGAQIGTLAALGPLLTLISAPLWSGFSDSTGRHKLTLMGGITGAWVAVLLMSQMVTFSGLLPAVALFSIFTAPIIPLVDNSVMELLGLLRNRYGHIRVWGAVGWGAVAIIIGPILQREGLQWAFYGYLFLTVVLFVAALGLPVAAPPRNRAPFHRGLTVLLGNTHYVALLLAVLVFGFSLSVILNYLFLYMRAMGAPTGMMSYTLVFATIAEIPFWFISDRLFNRFGRTLMIVIALSVMSLRLLAYGIMPAAWWAVPLGLLHGPTFAIMWAAGVAEADAAAPPGLGATAQGLISAAMFGLGAALGAFIGGIGYDAIGPQQLFLINAVMMAITAVIFAVSRKLTGTGRKKITVG